MRRALRLLLALICILSLLTGCAHQEREWDRRPMVLVKGTIYLDTGKQIPVEVHESAVLGEITSSVDPSEIPTEEGQSNFGWEGAEYAFYEDGLVVLIDHEWVLFEKETEE